MSIRIILELASTIAVRVTVVLCVAGLVYLVACWRRASAAHRHLIWSIALVASLCLPLFGSVLPPLRVPIPAAFRALPEPAAQSLGFPTESAQVRRPTVEVQATVIHEAPARVVTRSSHAPLLSFAELLLAIYVGGFVILIAGIIRDHSLLSRLTREAELVSAEPWQALLKGLAERTNVRRPVKLLRSHSSVSPLTAGIVRPVIVIPSSAEEWSSRRREAVLLHELAHVARHDCLTQTLAAVACALYWPHPLAWLAAARLRVDRELACDDAVLTRGIFARDYARDLLELARALSMPVPRLAVSMAGVRELEGRLRSLIDGARSRRAPSRAMTTVAIVGACVAGLLVAIVRPAPVAAAAAPVQAPAVASRPTPTAAPSRFGGQFAIRLTTPADGPENQRRVHVMLWTPGINTFYSEMRELAGLTREQLLTDGATLKFSLHRDAGALEFSGVARHATAQGQFSFEADTSFNRALADRGIAAITPEDQFSFARHNLSLAFLDELARLGYPTPTRRELVVAATSGADLKYLREMSALGYRASSLSGLVALSNQGVDPAFVRRLSAIGYRSLPVADLLQLRNEDVDSTFIADANARAGRRLSVGELILLRMNRSESEPPAAEPIADDTVTTGRWMLHTLPGGMLQLDIEWANVNQWRRLLRASDITELDQGRFRLAQDAGVFTFERGGDFSFAPNKGFLATLRSLGVRDADRIGIHQLKNLAFGFMSADSVKEIMGEGLAPLTLHDVVDLAVYQITPGFVRQVKASGYEDLTLRRLVDIKMGARVPKVVGGER